MNFFRPSDNASMSYDALAVDLQSEINDSVRGDAPHTPKRVPTAEEWRNLPYPACVWVWDYSGEAAVGEIPENDCDCCDRSEQFRCYAQVLAQHRRGGKMERIINEATIAEFRRIMAENRNDVACLGLFVGYAYEEINDAFCARCCEVYPQCPVCKEENHENNNIN